MKDLIICISIVCISLLSCKKDDNVAPESTPILVDEIITVDIEPDIVLSPISGFYQCDCPISGAPLPYDSSVTAFLDIDEDGSDDFRITYINSYYWVSASSPMANFNSLITIAGLQNEYEIAQTDSTLPYAKGFEIEDEIGNMEAFKHSVYIRLDHTQSYYGYYFLNLPDDGYIGVKIANAGYGWIKLSHDPLELKVFGFGYNKTNGLSIKAGQLE